MTTQSIRRIGFISAASLLLLGAGTASAQRFIRPMGFGMGFRAMPVFRVTPALNGLTGRAGPLFSVRTGVVAVPRFSHEFRREMMLNRNLMLGQLALSGLGTGMMGSYGSYPSMSSYGGGGGGYGQMTSVPQLAASYENNNNANGGLGGKAPEVSRILTAAGLPNEEGQLIWPIGLQALFPATENAALTSQINASLHSAALQKTSGSVDAELLKGTIRAAGRLRQMLLQREPYLQAPTYREADRFLKNLDNALKQMGATASASR